MEETLARPAARSNDVECGGGRAQRAPDALMAAALPQQSLPMAPPASSMMIQHHPRRVYPPQTPHPMRAHAAGIRHPLRPPLSAIGDPSIMMSRGGELGGPQRPVRIVSVGSYRPPQHAQHAQHVQHAQHAQQPHNPYYASPVPAPIEVVDEHRISMPSAPSFLSRAQQECVRHDLQAPGEVINIYNKNRVIRRRCNPITRLFVCFFRGATSESSQLLKRGLNTAITITGEFSHCELAFMLQDGRYMVCTIKWGENVSFECKQFDYSKWSIVALIAVSDQMDDIYDYCLDQQNKPFSKSRIVANFLPGVGIITWILSLVGLTNSSEDQQDFFCSELIMRALQVAMPEMVQYDAGTLTPTQLYNILKKHHKGIVDTLAMTVSGDIVV